jgi:hypothetical protein
METGAQAKRPSIADIIRSSGSFDSGDSGRSDPFAQFAALAAAVVPGASAAQLAVSAKLGEALSNRFNLSKDQVAARDYDVPYETAGRAAVLALHASACKLGAAFDTASGAVLEAKIPMSLIAPEITLTVALTDITPSTARVSITARHPGLDVLHFNDKTLAALFAKIDEYLARFAS